MTRQIAIKRLTFSHPRGIFTRGTMVVREGMNGLRATLCVASDVCLKINDLRVIIRRGNATLVRLCAYHHRVRTDHVQAPTNDRRSNVYIWLVFLSHSHVPMGSIEIFRKLRTYVRPRGSSFLFRCLPSAIHGIPILPKCRFKEALRRHSLQARQGVRKDGF